MQLNDKIQNFWTLLDKYFLIPFFSAIALVFLCFYTTPLHLFYFSKTTAIYTTIISAFIAFFFWFRRLREEKLTRKLILEFLSTFFCMMIVLLVAYFIDIFNGTTLDLLNKGKEIFLLFFVLIFFFLILYFGKREDITDSTDTKLKKIFKNKYLILGFLFVIFLALRVTFVVLYEAPYIDEYLHIHTGESIMESGTLPSFSVGEKYTRGLYVSTFIGILLKISGNNIIIAKILFLIICIFNFLLLYRLTKNIRLRDNYAFLFFLLYTINPLIILNHTYIRMFVFYELFLLLVLNIFFDLLLKTEKGDQMKSGFLLILFNLFFLLTKEFETYIFILISVIFLVIKYHKYILEYRRILVPILALLAIIVLKTKGGLLYTYLYGKDVVDGLGDFSRYFNLFFRQYLLQTLFFITSFVVYLLNKNRSRVLFTFLFISNIIFLFHQVISPAYKAIRGILYFLPLYVLVFVWTLDNTALPKKIKYFSAGLIILTSLHSLILFMESRPNIEKEINSFEYRKAYTFLREECKGNKYSLIHSPMIAKFYSVEIKDIIYLKKETLITNEYYYKDPLGHYRLVYDNTDTVNSPEGFEEILKEENVCIITATELRHSRMYVKDEIIKRIQENLEPIEFYGLTVYRRR